MLCNVLEVCGGVTCFSGDCKLGRTKTVACIVCNVVGILPSGPFSARAVKSDPT